MASRVAADKIINLFVLDQVTLVAATNMLLSNALHASRVQAERAGRAQAGTKQLHIVCAQTYEYVQVCALSTRTKNQL